LPTVTATGTSLCSVSGPVGASIRTVGTTLGRRTDASAPPSANGTASTSTSGRPLSNPATSGTKASVTSRTSAAVGRQPVTT